MCGVQGCALYRGCPHLAPTPPPGGEDHMKWPGGRIRPAGLVFDTGSEHLSVEHEFLTGINLQKVCDNC